MKVLYISDFLYFADSGAHVSAKVHLKTLKQLYGNEYVSVIALTGKEMPTSVVDTHIIIKGYKNPVSLLCGCLLGYPTYLNKKGIYKILSVVRNYGIDMVFIDNSIFGRLTKQIKKEFPKILVASYYHDVKAKLAKDWKDVAPFYRKPVYSAMIKNERLNQQYCDINFTLNGRESQLFYDAYNKFPEAELSVYLDVPLDHENISSSKMESKLKLLFFGGYYGPNINGIKWFVQNVIPSLPDSVELRIAGNNMERLKKFNFPKNVIISGRVEDLSKVYLDADIVISPIFEGGGMKVKIAEAMAYGKVVLGTDESYEGYQEHIPKDYWEKLFYRCNTAHDFIVTITEISRQYFARDKFNSEIRELYEKFYSPQYACETIGGAIQKYFIVRDTRM